MTLLERLGGRAEITRGIVAEFRRLSRHPHASWHEAATARDVAERLLELGVRPVLDEAGNTMAEVPPSPGREGAPLLLVQGHLDMVCAVSPGSGFDPLTDPVCIRDMDALLRSDGRSSLGADNMLGNAAVLWLLSGRKIAHGPLRLIFTVAEELGLEGAKRVNPGWLSGGAYLLNTDGFHLGRAIVGAAGGRRETYTRPLNPVPAPAGTAWRISLTGGAGGHSGYDIHLGRINAVKALGELLALLRERTGCALAAWEAGTAHNAIPAQGSLLVVCPPETEGVLRPTAEAWFARCRAAHAQTDHNLDLTIAPAPRPGRVWTAECRDGALALVNGLWNGVAAMHPEFSGVVGDSANVGKIGLEEGQLQVCAFLRCRDAEREAALAARQEAAARAAGFAWSVSGYPAWPGAPDNPLALLLERVYREQTGRTLEISAVHVGLEPSIFQSKAPGLVMVSTGPEILDAHSVDERAPLHALPDYALLLAGFWEAL